MSGGGLWSPLSRQFDPVQYRCSYTLLLNNQVRSPQLSLSLSLSLSLHFLNFTLSTAAYTLRDTVCAVNTQALIKLSHSPYRHMYSYLRQLVTHSLGNHYLKLSFDNLPDLRQKSRLFSWGWGGDDFSHISDLFGFFPPRGSR